MTVTTGPVLRTAPRAAAVAVMTTDGASITWDQLVADFAPALVSYARSKGIRAPEDLVQEVLVTAVERLSEFDGDRAGLRSWLFSITYRRIADEHRRFYRRPEVLVAEHPQTVTAGDDVDMTVILEDSAREAFAALDILGERERTVLEMRIIDEASPAEVAAALGISAGNVRVIQARALVKVRKYLKSRSGSMASAGMLLTFVRYFSFRLPADDAVLGPWIQQIKDGAADPSVVVAVSTAASAALNGAATAMATTSATSLSAVAGNVAKVGLVLTLVTSPVLVSGDVAQSVPVPISEALVVSETSNDLAVPAADDPVQGSGDPSGTTSPPGEVSTVSPDDLPQPSDEPESETGSDLEPEPAASEEPPPAEPEGSEEPADDGQVGETIGVVEEVVEPVTEGVVEPLLEGTIDLVTEGVVAPLVDEVVEPLVDDVVEPLVNDVVVPVVDETVGQVVDPVVEQAVEPLVDDVVDPLLDGLLSGPNGLLSGEGGLFGG